MGLGIGSFIGGAFQGFSFGEDYKNTKADRKRRDKLDEMAEEDRERRHRRENLDLAWTIEDREQAKKDRELLKGIYREGAELTDEAMEGAPVDTGIRTTTSESERRLLPPPAAPRGIEAEDIDPAAGRGRGVRPMARPEAAPVEEAPPQPSPVAARGVRPQPRPGQEAEPELSARERGFAAANPGWMDEKLGKGHATREDDEEDVGAEIANNAALARRTLESGNFPPEVAAELERIASSDQPRKTNDSAPDVSSTAPQGMGAAPEQGRAPDMPERAGFDRRDQPQPSPVVERAGPVMQERPEPGWMDRDMGPSHAGNHRASARGVRPPQQPAAPVIDANPARPAAPAAPTAPGTAPAAPVAPAAPGAAPQAPQPPIAEELAQQGTPSGQELAETVAEDAEATSRGATRPARQVAREWVDEYARTGAPYVQEQLLRNGMLDEAKQFGEWIQTQETQAGMEAYASAALAAGRGDIEGFAESVYELYNNEGYYPDGLTIDTEATSWIEDDAGNIVGAEVTFRDSDGDPIVHTYETLDDLIEEAMTLLAPEQAFAHRLEQQATADKARVELAMDDRDREADFQDFLRKEMAKAEIGGTGGGGKNTALKRAQEVAEELAADLTGDWADMTNEERSAAIAERMAMEQEAAELATNPAAAAPKPIEPWRG